MKIDQILEQVDGVVEIADDIVVCADEEHDRILHKLMQVAAKNGCVLNMKKCTMKVESMSFLGLVYSDMKSDPREKTNNQ